MSLRLRNLKFVELYLAVIYLDFFISAYIYLNYLEIKQYYLSIVDDSHYNINNKLLLFLHFTYIFLLKCS